MAKFSVDPTTRSGDPFFAVGGEDSEENGCAACYDGWVFIGHMVESPDDLDGEVVEYERVPCRLCNR